MAMDTFLTPANSHRGTELFMLNDRLDEEELANQIRQMKEQGFYSFIARTYIGLKSDYPGQDWKSKMAAIIKASKEYDMKVFLQAGYMPGGVPDLPEEYTHSGIRPLPKGTADPNAVKVLKETASTAYTLMIQPNFLDMLGKKAVAYYAKKSYEEMWAEFGDEYGKTAISVWVDEPHFCPPDLPWTGELPELFKNMWGYDIVDKVDLLFENSGDYHSVRYHYWRVVLVLLQEAYFSQISKWCKEHNLMFSGHLMGEDTLFAQISYTCDCMPLYKYFDIPGIDYLTADLDWKSHQIMGLGENYLFLNTPIQAVSAAHQAGKEEILCEMFGVSKQNLTFAEQRRLFDFFASMGINHKMVHGVFYSLQGRAKRAYPPHVNYYQPYWKDYRLVNDYFARVSWFISQGKPSADILVLHPVESAFSVFNYYPRKPNTFPEIEEALYGRQDRIFNELLQKLMGGHYPFHLGDEETISQSGSVNEKGEFAVGVMAYRTVIVPDLCVIRKNTLKLLKEFSAAGGRVILQGQVPSMLDGFPCGKEEFDFIPQEERCGDNNDLLDYLEKTYEKPYLLEADGNTSDIFINYRTGEDERFFFILNRNIRETKNITLGLPGEFDAIFMEAETGAETPVITERKNGKSVFSFPLPPVSSSMFRCKKAPTPSAGSAKKSPRPCWVLELPAEYSVKRKDPNVLLLETPRFARGNEALSAPTPILAIQHQLIDQNYSGDITLEYTVNSAGSFKNLSLALEKPGEQNIEFNGTPVSGNVRGYYCDKSFETLALPDVMVQGKNTIRIKRKFIPTVKPKTDYAALYTNLGGVELEALYLLGDFGVFSPVEPTNTNCVRFNPGFTLKEERGRCGSEITITGYPFYAGTMVLEQEFDLDWAPDTETSLMVNNFNACTARISINGEEAGTMCWQPYTVPIGKYLKQGKNTIAIELTNTLRNLLGPYHRPAGEPNYCWGSYSTPDHPWMGTKPVKMVAKDTFDEWYLDRVPDSKYWTEAYLQAPFGIGSVIIRGGDVRL